MEPFSLPSGALATLINPDDMTNGQRKPLVKLFVRMQAAGVVSGDPTKGVEGMEVDMSALDEDMIFDMTELVITAMLHSWTYDLPVERASLDNIPARDYDALSEKCMESFDSIMGVTVVDPTKPKTSSTT